MKATRIGLFIIAILFNFQAQAQPLQAESFKNQEIMLDNTLSENFTIFCHACNTALLQFMREAIVGEWIILITTQDQKM